LHPQRPAALFSATWRDELPLNKIFELPCPEVSLELRIYCENQSQQIFLSNPDLSKSNPDEEYTSEADLICDD
jgi:hypothetical protein